MAQLVQTAFGAFQDATGRLYVRNDDGTFAIWNPQVQELPAVPENGQNEQNGQGNRLQEAVLQRPVLKVGASVGQLESFKMDSHWDIYAEQLEQYLQANYIEEDKKVSVLITAIGTDVYKTLRDLCDPVLPQN